MLQRASLLAAGAGFLSLLTNRLPLVSAACFVLSALLTVQSPRKIAVGVAAVWAFWLASFLMSTESDRKSTR